MAKTGKGKSLPPRTEKPQVEESAVATLMAEANGPTPRASQKPRKRKRGKKTAANTAPAASTVPTPVTPQPAPPVQVPTVQMPTQKPALPSTSLPRAQKARSDGKEELLIIATEILYEVLKALKTGGDPVRVIFQGMARLYGV